MEVLNLKVSDSPYCPLTNSSYLVSYVYNNSTCIYFYNEIRLNFFKAAKREVLHKSGACALIIIHVLVLHHKKYISCLSFI